jgi:hypothetical protein
MVRVSEHCCFLFVINILYVVYRHVRTMVRGPTRTNGNLSGERLDMARDIDSVPNLMPGGERPASPSARERRYKRILVAFEAASQGVDDASAEEFDRVLAAVARQVPDATLGEIAFALVWAEREAEGCAAPHTPPASLTHAPPASARENSANAATDG